MVWPRPDLGGKMICSLRLIERMTSRAIRRPWMPLALFAVALLGGCLGDPASSGVERSEAEHRTLAVGWSSGVQGPLREVVRDADAWERLWAVHESRATPAQPRPEVDFSKERVVAVFLGTRPDSCWAVRITNVTLDASGRRAAVEVTTYQATEGACMQALSQPHHVIALPHLVDEVTFTDRSVEGRPADAA